MFRWIKQILDRNESPVEKSEEEGRLDQRVDELLEGIQRLTRTHAKQALRVEGLESKLEGGFTEMRSQLAKLAVQSSSESSLNWSELLDAMDILEEACRSLEERDEREMAAGLRGALGRLDRFLSDQVGLSRINQTDGALNGKLFRIVAVDDRLGPSDSLTTRVVRAAVLRGDKLMREGELIVNRA
jgi:molecular chaperone GrpE (heat shock protein)